MQVCSVLASLMYVTLNESKHCPGEPWAVWRLAAQASTLAREVDPTRYMITELTEFRCCAALLMCHCY